MYIAEAAIRRHSALLLSLLVLGVGCPIVRAHPVAQGAIAISVSDDRVRIHASVSAEEVLVAGTTASPTQPSGSGQIDAVHAHGEYLLRHLRLMAENLSLSGRVTAVPKLLSPRLEYDLEFLLPDGRPHRLQISQDLLREIPFAPGNSWEASFIVSVDVQGKQVSDGLLLLPDRPLDLNPTPDSGESSGKGRLVASFIHHGIRHILTGYDHLLFVSALTIAVRSLWDLVKVISTFTLAHTITLSLAAFNIVRLPAHIVEPMIALSIVVVAALNVLAPDKSRGTLRLAITFCFGLFHGLGFAGGLLDAMAEMPRSTLVLALAAFSLGVEIGHQLVVLPLYATLRIARSEGTPRKTYRPIERFGSAAICLAGGFYFIAAIK